jgi:hypothetical protein
MYTFKTKPDGFQQIRRTMIFRDFPLLLLTLIYATFMVGFEKSEKPINWYPIATIAIMMAVIITFVFIKIITRQRHIYEEFVLTIDENGITREQHYSDTLTIATHEVSKIYKKSNGSLVINGADVSEKIIIPPQMEEPEKLEYKLAGIKSFSQMPFLEKYWLISPLTVLGLVSVFFIATNKWLVGVSGLILLGLHGYSLFSSYRHKNIAYIPKSILFLTLNIVFIIVRKIYSAITCG